MTGKTVHEMQAEHGQKAAVEAYAGAVGDYHEGLSRRADYLKSRLFKVENADAGMEAVSKTAVELGAALKYAIKAGNADMGRAVFVAAEERGLGDLMARYFDNIDPEARGLYEEWVYVPPAEVLERQREGVGTILPEPDPAGLMPFARANT